MKKLQAVQSSSRVSLAVLFALIFMGLQEAPGMLTNASFDTPDYTHDFTNTGWNAFATGVGREPWAARSGPRGGTLYGWSVGQGGVFQDVPATNGTYTFSLWLFRESRFNPVYVHLKLEWYDAASNLLEAATNDLTHLHGDCQWHHVFVTDTCTDTNVAFVRPVFCGQWDAPLPVPGCSCHMFDDAALYTGTYAGVTALSKGGFECCFSMYSWRGSRWYCLPHPEQAAVHFSNSAHRAGSYGVIFEGWRADSNSYTATVGQNLTPEPGTYEFSAWMLRQSDFLLTQAQLKMEWFDSTYTNKVQADTVTNLSILNDGAWHQYAVVGTCTNPDLFEARAKIVVQWDYNSTGAVPRGLMLDDAYLRKLTFEAGSQPDLLIRRRTWGDEHEGYAGLRIYNDDGAGQTKLRKLETDQTAIYDVRVENHYAVAKDFVVQGDGSAGNWNVDYYDASNSNITSEVTGSGRPISVNAGAYKDMRLEVTPSNSVPDGATNGILVTCTSATEANESDTVKAVATKLAPTTIPVGAAWTTDEDFEEGFMYRTRAAGDQLHICATSMPLPYIWIPNSNEGTVSKVHTETGRELARYRVAPGTHTNASCSRTTMDQYGNCWVGNRVIGTVVKIGLSENTQYQDRNTNTVMDTCSDTNGDGHITADEMLPWGEDECVLFEVVLIPGLEGTYAPGDYTNAYANYTEKTGPRATAVDAQGNVWAGCYGSQKYYYLNGWSGQIAKTVNTTNHTPYGAIVDGNGILWSAGQDKNHVLRLDPSNDSYSVVNVGHFCYGLGLDADGHLFVSAWDDGKLSRIDVNTATIDWTRTNSALWQGSRGVAVTLEDGDVWIVNSWPGTVTRCSNDGEVKSTICLGDQSVPTGVAVDREGKVWVTDSEDEFIHRIDPATDEVEFSIQIVGGLHYGYSDMCGTIADQITDIGTWIVTHNSGVTDTPWTWGGEVTWNATEPSGSVVRVKVRSSNNLDDWSDSDWETATNGALNEVRPGKYMQIEVVLERLSDDAEPPVLSDVTITNAPDTDNDGLPNGWEYEYSGSYTAMNASVDQESDGLTNDMEYWWGTVPTNSDTDADGLSDGDEVNIHGCIPTDPDSDDDTLSDGYEVMIGTSPMNPDTDGDAMDDAFEDYYYPTLDPMYAGDAGEDADGDHASNLHEYRAGTDLLDMNSYLGILTGQCSNRTDGFVIRWMSVSNRKYSVLRAADLLDGSGFTPIASGVVTTPGTNSYTDGAATAEGPYYYRIEVEEE